jgi:hypothetical protein
VPRGWSRDTVGRAVTERTRRRHECHHHDAKQGASHHVARVVGADVGRGETEEQAESTAEAVARTTIGRVNPAGCPTEPVEWLITLPAGLFLGFARRTTRAPSASQRRFSPLR